MRIKIVPWSLGLLAVGLLLMTSGCGEVAPVAAEVARSDLPRQEQPDTTETELSSLVAGNSAFAFDLYQLLRADQSDNLFFSPHSISLALAMTYAGARQTTAEQMAQTLHFTLDQERLHPALNALDLSLTGRAQESADESETPFELHIANDLWGQKGYAFEPAFLDTLAQNYAAEMRLLDFQQEPEAARKTINAWISEQTNDRIQDLIPSGGIDTLTRLVLTNAIYFNGGWMHQFDKDATRDDSFTQLDGSQVTVPMMSLRETLGYAEGEGYQAIELPYRNDIAMLIMLPAADQFTAFEETLNADQVQSIVDELTPTEVVLTMPKFEIDGASFSLNQALTTLGMVDAFGSDVADFSGIDGTRDLFISDVLHQANITVDEQGTEAAAATAVLIEATSALVPLEPTVEMNIDRPFVFVIRDTQTGAILFVGRVVAL